MQQILIIVMPEQHFERVKHTGGWILDISVSDTGILSKSEFTENNVKKMFFLTSTHFFSDEVKVNSPDDPGKATIIAFSVWGILR